MQCPCPTRQDKMVRGEGESASYPVSEGHAVGPHHEDILHIIHSFHLLHWEFAENGQHKVLQQRVLVDIDCRRLHPTLFCQGPHAHNVLHWRSDSMALLEGALRLHWSTIGLLRWRQRRFTSCRNLQQPSSQEKTSKAAKKPTKESKESRSTEESTATNFAECLLDERLGGLYSLIQLPNNVQRCVGREVPPAVKVAEPIAWPFLYLISFPDRETRTQSILRMEELQWDRDNYHKAKSINSVTVEENEPRDQFRIVAVLSNIQAQPKDTIKTQKRRNIKEHKREDKRNIKEKESVECSDRHTATGYI